MSWVPPSRRAGYRERLLRANAEARCSSCSGSGLAKGRYCRIQMAHELEPCACLPFELGGKRQTYRTQPARP